MTAQTTRNNRFQHKSRKLCKSRRKVKSKQTGQRSVPSDSYTEDMTSQETKMQAQARSRRSKSSPNTTDSDTQNDNARFMALLVDPTGVELFKAHLLKNYTEHHLCFWQEVQIFRQITDETELAQSANTIYSTYVRKGAKREINITERLKSAVKERLATPTIEMFADAERTSIDLIKGNFFFTFLQTADYKNWQAMINKPNKKTASCAVM